MNDEMIRKSLVEMAVFTLIEDLDDHLYPSDSDEGTVNTVKMKQVRRWIDRQIEAFNLDIETLKGKYGHEEEINRETSDDFDDNPLTIIGRRKE